MFRAPPPMTTPLDRQATCPQCGAPMTFRFAGAAAQVCKHCSFVVARTDRGLAAVGRVADLVEIPSPLGVGVTGRWGDKDAFVVEGRVQVDRVDAPGAPWQEFFVAFPQSGRWCWVASAQGRWYSTREMPLPPGGVPRRDALRPGAPIDLGPYGRWTVAEVGRRRVVSAEGELPRVAAPGVPTGYADLGGPDGAFATIDYGDGSAPPELFVGRVIDPAVMALDSGVPVTQPEAQVTALACPSCGGNLPLAAPGTTERIVCRYCGMASDLANGALRAMWPAPKPPQQPFVPLGAAGLLRGDNVLCIAYLIRGCTVDGERYRWREYLLYGGPRVGYRWLMEEDGEWKLVRPLEPGEVMVVGHYAKWAGRTFHHKQRVSASVEHVVGELYWRVEVGETVDATDFADAADVLSVERAPSEVTYSLCEPIAVSEIVAAFGLGQRPGAPLPTSGGSGGESGLSGCLVNLGWVVFVILLLLVSAALELDDCGGGGGGFGGPSFGGGK
jgi:hypothetical protein